MVSDLKDVYFLCNFIYRPSVLGVYVRYRENEFFEKKNEFLVVAVIVKLINLYLMEHPLSHTNKKTINMTGRQKNILIYFNMIAFLLQNFRIGTLCS